MKGQVVGKDGIPGRYTQEKIKKVLFDLKKDPGETQDISKDHPDIVKRLEQIAQQARTDLGDKLKDQKGNGLREPDRLSLQSSSAK